MSQLKLKKLWQVSAFLRSDKNGESCEFSGLVWADDKNEIVDILHHEAALLGQGYDNDAKVLNLKCKEALGTP